MNFIKPMIAAMFLGGTLDVQADLTACKFNFGMAWQGPTYAYPAQVDYGTLWTGGDEDFNVFWDGAMLNACKPGGKLAGRTPVFYSYIIAFTARRDLGLKDCDVGTPNLCQQGANFIRQKCIGAAHLPPFRSNRTLAPGTGILNRPLNRRRSLTRIRRNLLDRARQPSSSAIPANHDPPPP